MSLATEEVRAGTLSEGWLRTLDLVSESPGRRLFHTVTRISSPLEEDPAIRAMAEQLASELGNYRVETVANTIFPAALAATSASHEILARRYLAMYPRLKRIDRNNARGTYFGRLVAHPSGPGGSVNQLSGTIRKLRSEAANQGPKSARYEVSVEAPSDHAEGGAHELDPDPETLPSLESVPAMQAYAAGRDNSIMAFPCLSFCSFQLDQGSLHLIAQYRAQSLIERGYGNYLGLARLQQYVASQACLATGGLMVVAGRADAVGAPKFRIQQARATSGATVP